MPENFRGFSKNTFFEGNRTVLEAKIVKIGLQKQLWQPEEQTLF
jgi:hypothetical protein